MNSCSTAEQGALAKVIESVTPQECFLRGAVNRKKWPKIWLWRGGFGFAGGWEVYLLDRLNTHPFADIA